MDNFQLAIRKYQAGGWVITQSMQDSFLATRAGPRPAWTVLVAILLFPIGLLALTVKGDPVSTLVTRQDADRMFEGEMFTPLRAETLSPEQIAKNRRTLKVWLVIIALMLFLCIALMQIGAITP